MKSGLEKFKELKKDCNHVDCGRQCFYECGYCHKETEVNEPEYLVTERCSICHSDIDHDEVKTICDSCGKEIK